MKNTAYKNALEKIECSESFRRRMQNLLTENVGTDDGYIEVTAQVERVKPRKISTFLAAVAACVAVFAGGILVYRNFSAPQDTMVISYSYEDIGEILPGDTDSIKILSDYGVCTVTDDSYEYVSDENTLKILYSAAKKRIGSFLYTQNWKNSLITSKEEAEALRKKNTGDFVHLNYQEKDLYIFRNGLIEFRCQEKEIIAFFEADYDSLYDEIVKAINGVPSPVEDFTKADIEISYNGKDIPLTDKQTAEIQQMLNTYDWVEETMVVGSCFSSYDFRISYDDESYNLTAVGTLDFYKNTDSIDPDAKYVQTPDFVERLDDILGRGNPQFYEDYSACDVSIRYGTNEYVNVSSENNKQIVLDTLNNTEWNLNDTHFSYISSLIDCPFVVLVTENGQEYRYFINPELGVEFTDNTLLKAYSVSSDFAPAIFSVYYDEVGTDITNYISAVNFSYYGTTFYDKRNEKLREILSRCAPTKIDSIVLPVSDACLSLKSAAGDAHIRLYDNGYVSYYSNNKSILYTLDHESISEAVKIATENFDYTRAFRNSISPLSFSPLSSYSVENIFAAYVGNPADITNETPPMNISDAEGLKLWEILSSSEAEPAEYNDFKDEDFYIIAENFTLTENEYFLITGIKLNSLGYVIIGIDDHSSFTFRLPEQTISEAFELLASCRNKTGNKTPQ